jgi:hypothetical protein
MISLCFGLLCLCITCEAVKRFFNYRMTVITVSTDSFPA